MDQKKRKLALPKGKLGRTVLCAVVTLLAAPCR